MSGSISSSLEGRATLNENVTSLQNPTADPFHTPFDDNHGEEWWDNEEIPEEAPEKAPAPSRWPTVAERDVSKRTHKSTRKPLRKYSVHKLTREKSRKRQKMQNAAAGIKLDTNFSRHQGPIPITLEPNQAIEGPQTTLQPGCFVDLPALQAIDSQAPSNNRGLWKSIKGMIPIKGESSNGPAAIGAKESHDLGTLSPSEQVPTLGHIGSRRGQGLMPPPLRLQSDLSPCDRPIMIGISIPSASFANHATSPQTASDAVTAIDGAATLSSKGGIPETPTIIITPSQLPSTWYDPSQNDRTLQNRHRANSDVYFHATTHSTRDSASSNVPTISQMPAFGSQTPSGQKRKSRKSIRNSASTIFSEDGDIASTRKSRAVSSFTVFEEDESPILSRKTRAGDIVSARKSRAVSTFTVFEEDESPILARKTRAVSVFNGNMPAKQSVLTAVDQRDSKGWWNYLTSPFSTRRNTLGSPRSATQEHPALPSLATAAINAQGGGNPREWEKSAFSPLTPETTTTITSDSWWDKRNTTTDVSSPEEESGTLPFVLAAGEATMMNFSNQAALEQSSSNEDNLKRRPALRDKFSASNAGASIRPIESNPAPPTLATRNPYLQPSVQDLNSSPAPIARHVVNNTQTVSFNSVQVTPSLQGSPQPPPYSPARVHYPRYHAVFPPGHHSNFPEPLSPGPVTPGLQQAISSRGGIALGEVPSATTPRRPINLNSGYPGLPARPKGLPIRAVDLEQPSKKARKVEARRRRYEKEEAIAHKVGGLWRGRGCIPERGCYGRGGAEGRKRRRCWFGLIAGFLTMIILIVVLSTTLHRNSAVVVEQSQWLNLTGFPPIFTGVSTVAAPDNPVANSGCVFPATIWSCSLPKELQQSVAPNQPNQPNFRIQIQWDNSSEANTTFTNVTGNPNLTTRSVGSNAVSAGQFMRSLIHMARRSLVFTPSPAPPSYAEQFFLGNTTDGIVSDNKAGEPTPFYISLLSTSTSAKLLKRENSSSAFPDITAELEANFPPDRNSDGTAAPANLLPFPVQQPLRLYDRGLDSEHYGFYNYFNRSIFLKSIVALNSSNLGNGEVPDDENGGALESAASWRCTWSETRFLVQIWTRKGSTASLLNSTASSTSSSMSSSSVNYTANDFTVPGSFPYPITITTDRHGGQTQLKHLYCYELDTREQPISSSAKELGEQKDFGGVAVNSGSDIFTNITDTSLGGFDGGTGGCSCQWKNWNLHG